MRNLIKPFIALFIGLALIFGLSACTEGESSNSGASKENKARINNYDKLVASQPAHSMGYSPTRETKNFWIDTWGQKGKLSYIYLLNQLGEPVGYYVLDGLPVSYCTSLVPPLREYKVEGDSSSQRGELGPAPSIDGTFSSSANCNVFYGKDATTGAYIEYTTGQGLNALLYDQPLPLFADAKPLGQTEVADIK